LRGLVRLKDARAFDLARRLFEIDAHPLQRIEAAEALEMLGDPRAIPLLTRALEASDPAGRSGEMAAAGRLARRREAALALGGFPGEPAALAALEKSLADPDLLPYASLALYRLTRDAKYEAPAKAIIAADPVGDSLLKRYASRIKG
jgi:HEAT repeat protein